MSSIAQEVLNGRRLNLHKFIPNKKLVINKLPFPMILHEMLKDVTQHPSHHTIVSWQPHGKAFRVHNQEDFTTKIIPYYFNQKKYKSFIRQLNVYGFRRILSGFDKGAYYHKMFLRANFDLCLHISRCEIKGTGGKRKLSETEDPDFYADFVSHDVPKSPLLRGNESSHLISGVPESDPSLDSTPLFSIIQIDSPDNPSPQRLFRWEIKKINESNSQENALENGVCDGVTFEGRRFYPVESPACM